MKLVFDLINADSVNAMYKESLMLFGQFVGSWAIVSTWFGEKGESKTSKGEWHFSWILDGCGIQDVLFGEDYPKEKYGTTIRCYDSKENLWRATWMQPGYNAFANLIGKKIDGDIVQELIGLPEKNKREIWRFTDITKTQFTWRDEVSIDDGKTWRLEQEMKGFRM